MLTINLFDANFAQSECSIAWKTPENVRYTRYNMEHDITLFTDGYVFDGVVDFVKSPVKIGWLHEPQCLWPKHYTSVPLDKFDFVMTYYQPLLDSDPRYVFSPYGGVWIDKNEWGMRKKTKLVSMLYGEKQSTEGHRLRHFIASNLDGIPGLDFYGARGTPTNYSKETKLQVLGDYMFTIVTETCSEDNLFTEILLDCFAVGTIPIFWGCPNIGEFFNTDGIVLFDNSLDWLVSKVWSLSPGLYLYMRAAAQQNLNTVEQYAITEDWQYENIYKRRLK